MPTRERPVDRASRIAQRDRFAAGVELREARIAGGLSLRAAAEAAGMSASHAARIERAQVPALSIDQVARLGAIVGLDVRLRCYPGPDSLRDAGHVALMARFRARLPPGVRLRTEVPLPIPGDARALDGLVDRLVDDARLPLEAETRLSDAQGQARRLMLKVRDAGFDDLLLIVADTRRNRAAVRAAWPVLQDLFPVPARRAMAALAAGRHPGGSALVFI